MNKHVLFIQGGGEGAYEDDAKVVDSLRKALGAAYYLHYPRRPMKTNQVPVGMSRSARKLPRSGAKLFWWGTRLAHRLC
jgi:hypothetical protein